MSEEANSSVFPKNNVKSKESLLLDVTFRRILENTVNKVSDEKFCSIFGEVCENRKSVMIRLHKVFKSTVTNTALEELNSLVEEEHIDEAMSRLAALVTRTRPDNTVVWRPPGNVEEHLRSFDMKEKLRRKQCLEDWVVSREKEVVHKQKQLEQETAALDLQESHLLPRLEHLRVEVAELHDCLQELDKRLTDCVSLASAFSLLPDAP